MRNLLRPIARFVTAGLGLALVLATPLAVPSAQAAGLRNCVDISGPQLGRVGCYENVWADGAEYRMTFSNQACAGATPHDLAPFYVVAPPASTAQGPMAGFPHDHVIRTVPGGGRYSVQLQGFFVLCTGQGLVSGACDALWTSPGGDPLPFAVSVNGHGLRSARAIEAAAAAGDLALVNLGPSAVIVGSVTGAAR
jgi:hypothetical protein